MPDEILAKLNAAISKFSPAMIVTQLKMHNIPLNDDTLLKLPALDQHLEKKAYLVNIIEQNREAGLREEESKEWAAIVPKFGNPGALNEVQAYIAKWENHTFAAEHVDTARKKTAEQMLEALKQEWIQISLQASTPSPSLLASIQGYISKCRTVSGAEAYAQQAEQLMGSVKAALRAQFEQQEQNEWALLQYGADIAAICNHVRKWHDSGIDTHAADADSTAWRLVQTATDRISAVRQYMQYFPFGAHTAEAQSAQQDFDLWMNVAASRDLFQVSDFIKGHPNSFFAQDARMLKEELKQNEIARIKELQDLYPADSMTKIIEDGIISENELIYHGVATENSIKILKDLAGIRDTLPKLEDVQKKCRTYCASDRTDIFLFGVPSTGKTCILMGLIGATGISVDLIESAGEYAAALQLYLRNGFTPGQTQEGFVATLQGTIRTGGNSHLVNLVELAGEDFAINIANKRQDGTISFAEMGQGVPALLSNSNRKVFFLIVDPTAKTLKIKKSRTVVDEYGNPVTNEYGEVLKEKDEYIVDQCQSLQKMINMLANPANKAIMEKVDALHVIVTKGDKLGDIHQREDKAESLFRRRYGQLLPDLIHLCKANGINQHPDKKLNGVPRLFVFSLGEFYPGGIYEYDPADANALVGTIVNSTVGERHVTLWDRFCNMMSRPIF